MPAAAQPLRTTALYFLGTAVATIFTTALLTLMSGDADAFTQTSIALRPIVSESAIATAAFLLISLFRTRFLHRAPRRYAGAFAFFIPALATIIVGILLQQTAVPVTTTFEAFPDIGLNEAESLLLQFLLLPLLLPLFIFPPPRAPLITFSDRRRRLLRRASSAAFLLSVAAFLLLLSMWIFSKFYSVDIREPTPTATVAFNVNNDAIRFYSFTPPVRSFQFDRANYNPPFKPLSSTFLIHFSHSPLYWDFALPLFPLTIISFLLLLIPPKHKLSTHPFPITPLPPTSSPTPA